MSTPPRHEPAFTCPHCGAGSGSWEDAANHYCGACRQFVHDHNPWALAARYVACRTNLTLHEAHQTLVGMRRMIHDPTDAARRAVTMAARVTEDQADRWELLVAVAAVQFVLLSNSGDVDLAEELKRAVCDYASIAGFRKPLFPGIPVAPPETSRDVTKDRNPAWGPCPNTPPCPHPALIHDVEDMAGTNPMCCAEGCVCRPAEQNDR